MLIKHSYNKRGKLVAAESKAVDPAVQAESENIVTQLKERNDGLQKELHSNQLKVEKFVNEHLLVLSVLSSPLLR